MKFSQSNSRFVRAKRASAGSVPVSALFATSKLVKDVNTPNVIGRLPVKKFRFNRSVSRFDKADNSDGNWPSKRLSRKLKLVRLLSLAICVGKVPDKLYPS